jgi:chromosome segregation ATPase
MTAFQEKAAKKEQELSQAEESLGMPSNAEEEKRERMDALLSEAQKQAALKRNLEEKLQKAQLPYKTAEREIQALKREKARADKRLKAARQCLQKARDQIMEQAGSSQSEEARRTAILKQTEEDLAVARDKVNELKQAVSSALRCYEELEPHVQDAKSKTKRLSNQLKGIDCTIKELESSSGDSLAMWGRNVAKVCQLVSQYNLLLNQLKNQLC